MNKTEVAIKTKAYAERYWLNNEIRYQYKWKNIILKNLEKIEQNFDSAEYYDIIEKMRSERNMLYPFSTIASTKKKVTYKKLNDLINNKCVYIINTSHYH